MDYEMKMERARRRNSESASGVKGFTMDLGQSSDGRATKRLTKKLLAEDMFKQTETRRRSPSSISGLMVLKEHARKQQKRISDSYEFYDASDEKNRRFLSRWRARSMLTKANHWHNHSHPDGSHTSFSSRAHNSSKSSKVLSEEKNKRPVRIVVLRLNHHGNTHNCGSSIYLLHRIKDEGTSVSAYDDIRNDENMYSSLEAYSEIQMEANVKDLYEKQLTLSETRRATSSSDPSISHRNKSFAVDNDEASACDQEEFNLQEIYERPPGSSPLQYVSAEPAFSESSREADHASPVSVLEVPSIEEASSCSKSFQKVSAEQNEAHYILGAEGRESSYALEVLIHSGLLKKLSLDTFTTKWYSPDCPLDTVLFDDLEKKYNNETTGFDRGQNES
ncbi:hypothetical protein CASFOL_009188 [Castilleja foliolosa]|uniref:DUF4378 domain-containing protein n=1 Tax=Castilleja foliolosa TaxID=1961234 RepID=A0ABD3E0T1_9LAMI